MQQHGSKHFAIRPPTSPDPWEGYTGQNSTFSDHGHVAYQINGNHEMQQHGSKHFARSPPTSQTTIGDGVKRSKFNFSEHGYVPYQIYGNQEKQQHGSKHFARRSLPPPLP